jgi:putative restriction endonuclease
LHDSAWRDQARRILVASYFQPSEQLSLYHLIGIPIPSPTQMNLEIAAAERMIAESTGREARFRISVVGAFDYTCALTGYRLTTVTAGSIVDAAHIHQFSDSRNNHPRNGIALCKNAHWLFDQGFWTLTDDYRILVVGTVLTVC